MMRSQIIQSFVARIWVERAADEDPKWRGHIQHIQGREEIYFQNLMEMCVFLEQVSAIPSMGFATHPRNDVANAKRGGVAGRKRKSGK